MRIATAFTKLLGLTTPIVSPPMGGPLPASTIGLASAVSNAGGFGFLSIGFADPNGTIDAALVEAHKVFNIPANQPIPIGVGFLGWVLDLTEPANGTLIERTLSHSPKAIWFSFGNDLGKYVKRVRAYDAKRVHKTVVMVQVQTVDAALRAANEWKVDAIVVQGTDAGGHGTEFTAPMFILLQAVLKALPNGPPLLAAGGIATGAQIAAVLTMGASGAVIGTRSITTLESGITPAMKSILVDANTNSTIRSVAFDEVGRTTGWPEGIHGRAIRNGIITDVEAGLSLEARLAKYDAAAAKKDPNYFINWAGPNVGLINKIEKTSTLINTLHNDAIKTLKSGGSLISK